MIRIKLYCVRMLLKRCQKSTACSDIIKLTALTIVRYWNNNGLDMYYLGRLNLYSTVKGCNIPYNVLL